MNCFTKLKFHINENINDEVYELELTVNDKQPISMQLYLFYFNFLF